MLVDESVRIPADDHEPTSVVRVPLQWERQRDETSRQFASFQIYRDTHPTVRSLAKVAEGLGLSFQETGKEAFARPGTLAFVRATFDYYASANQSMASGAAFAIENWAANYLWKPWIAGMEKLNASRSKPVDLSYLKYHDLEEQHHSQATLDELLENFVEPWFDSGEFLQGATLMLTDGVQAYYISQLETLPDKGDTWPTEAVEPRRFTQDDIPRISAENVRI